MRIAGIMSGTSLDGIDVAIVDVQGKRVETLGYDTQSYPSAVRARILEVSNTQCSTAQISRLNFELAELYSKAVLRTCQKTGIPAETLELVGCHGQTVYHEGKSSRGNTFQLGEAAVIAERLGVPVVSNFRTRDIAAGGHGAPLVPFVDVLLLQSPTINRVALNIGGIANITVLPKMRQANGRAPHVIAFDTGPGNMVMDQLMGRLTEGRQNFDRGGATAASGTPDTALLNALLSDRYFQAKPPKTAGREQYGSEFVERLIASGAPLPDLIATATVFTAATIAEGVRRFAPGTAELIAAGGGVHNPQLMGQLAAFLPGVRVTTTAEFGIDPDAKEAIAFAILAYRTWRKQPGNLPSATGARRAVILGSVTF